MDHQTWRNRVRNAKDEFDETKEAIPARKKSASYLYASTASASH
jgi:hypothetical protein